jgi:hypothetical protein
MDLQEEIEKEVNRLVTLSLRDRDKQGHVDLEALEFHIRSSMHSVGSILLERLINSDGGDYRGRTLRSERGELFEFKEYRDKEVLTVLGPVIVQRAYYYDQDCGEGYCPKDVALDIAETSFSPGVRRMMAKAGAYRPFGLGHEQIKEMAGLEVDSKAIERISHQLGEEVEGFYRREGSQFLLGKIVPLRPVTTMYICIDATGVPVVKAETANRKGKGQQGQAKTREAKLGCVFTQTTVDEKGHPKRDEDSTSYVGAIETTEPFGNRIDAEALRRGLERAHKVCVIGDAAPWIWNIVEEHFYGAIQIIDLYHARQHYWSVARAAFGSHQKKLNQWTEGRRKELNEGKVEDVIKAIQRLAVSIPEQKELLEGEIAYFEKNKHRMRYAEFRRQGLFVGSGVVEAGCRTVIGQRLKQSGMHWTVKGANNIIALRCCILSNRWEDFWEQRVSA